MSEAAHETAPAQQPELKLEFHGSARDYFRIWSVNLCLTLLTAGIFSAWAKVRKKRYFYSHTLLDGTPFQYLAQPLPILRGRLIAAALFIVYYAATHFFTDILPFVLVAGLVLAPWVLVRSAAFNARYSAFRNMTFRFDGDYLAAMRTIYWLGLIPVIVVGAIFSWWGNPALGGAAFAVCGLLFPWWMRRLRHFIVTRTTFGGQSAQFGATGRQFFRVYLVSGLILFAAGLSAGALIFALKNGGKHALLVAPVPVYVGYVFAFAYVRANTANLVWNHSELGPLRFQSTLRARGLARLYLTNALGIIASAGLLTPWAVIRTLRYRVDNVHVILQGTLDRFQGAQQDTVSAAGAEMSEFFDLDLSL